MCSGTGGWERGNNVRVWGRQSAFWEYLLVFGSTLARSSLNSSYSSGQYAVHLPQARKKPELSERSRAPACSAAPQAAQRPSASPGRRRAAGRRRGPQQLYHRIRPQRKTTCRSQLVLNGSHGRGLGRSALRGLWGDPCSSDQRAPPDDLGRLGTGGFI